MVRARDKDGGLQEAEKTSEKLYVGLTWDEASELALSRYSWRQRVANVPYTQDELRSRVRSFTCVPLFFELKLTF